MTSASKGLLAGWLDALTAFDASHLRSLRRLPVQSAKLLVFSVRKFRSDFAPQRAAALAYMALLSVIPLAIISLSFLRGLERLLDVNFEDRVESAVLEHIAPASQAQVEAYIASTFEKVVGRSGTLGILGVLGFLSVTAVMFLSIEKVFNEIWKIARRRSLLIRLLVFWGVVTFVPALLGLSFYLERPVRFSPNGPLRAVLAFAASVFLFFVVYRFLPATRVKVSSALLGALVAGSLWEASKLGFQFYIGHVISFEKIYGALGAIPVFVIWCYLTFVLLLFGAEVVYAHQHFRRLETVSRRPTPEPTAMMLAVAFVVGRAFREGRCPLDDESIAEEAGLTAPEATPILERLAQAGIFSRTGEAQGLYQLARDARSIRLVDLLGTSTTGGPSAARWRFGPLEPLLGGLEGARRERLGERTLADLIDRSEELPGV